MNFDAAIVETVIFISIWNAATIETAISCEGWSAEFVERGCLKRVCDCEMSYAGERALQRVLLWIGKVT